MDAMIGCWIVTPACVSAGMGQFEAVCTGCTDPVRVLEAEKGNGVPGTNLTNRRVPASVPVHAAGTVPSRLIRPGRYRIGFG